jgi:hypothetical protein
MQGGDVLKTSHEFCGRQWMVVKFLISIITLVVLYILPKFFLVLHVLQLLANFKLTTIQETGQY